jgi:hypothetical protein
MPQPQTIGEWKKYFDAAKADKKQEKKWLRNLRSLFPLLITTEAEYEIRRPSNL